MGYIHYIIIIVAVIIIAFFQLSIYKRTWSAIQLLKRIFYPAKRAIRTVNVYIPAEQISNVSVADVLHDLDSYEIPSEESEIKVTLIVLPFSENVNPVFHNILESINTYLIRNKNAASDFSLVKDIVERNCDAMEEEMETQLPLPLYLGLMGTMIGIVVGIGCVSIIGGGFSAFIANPEASIGLLMGGVAIAMLASLLGILLTTLGAWYAKDSKAKLESDKNVFYTWLQTELLPVVSMNTATSLQLLHQNLMSFNNSFSQNISKMDASLGKITDSFDNQVKLIGMLENLDIKRMATANIEVLKHLNSSTKEFEKFNSYMFNLNDYLNNVKELSSNVNQHLERTNAIEKMGQFFEDEIKAISERKSMMQASIVGVDDELKKAIEGLGENAEHGIGVLNKNLVSQQDSFVQSMEKQKEMALAHLQDAELLLENRLEQTSAILDELRQLPEVKECLLHWEEIAQKQNALLVELSRGIGELSHEFRKKAHSVVLENDYPSISSEGGTFSIPNWCKYAVIALLFLLAGILGMQVYSTVTRISREKKVAVYSSDLKNNSTVSMDISELMMGVKAVSV